LTMAGRATLIKSTLNNLPNHIMQYIHIPASIIKKMDKYQRNFLWGTTTTRKKLHLFKWRTVTQPIEMGGLGIQTLQQKNAALLGSLAWRAFHSHQILWAKVLINKYSTLRSTSNYSNIWRNIMRGWKSCQLGVQWQVGTGEHIKFWDDTWLGPGLTVRSLISGPIPNSHLNSYISSIYNGNIWNWTNLPFQFPKNLKMNIEATYISEYNRKADHIFWALTNHGKFTVNSLYKALQNQSNNIHGVTTQFKWIWNLPIHPKIKYFIWLLNHNRLLTPQYLNHLGITANAHCFYCHNGDESLNHLFFACKNAHTFWNTLGMGNYINSLLRYSTPQEWLIPLLSYTGNKFPYNVNRRTYLPLCLWNIWLTRNKNMYEGRQDQINKSFITKQATEYCYLVAPSHKIKNNIRVPLKWIPPAPNIYKLNTDAAHSTHSTRNGIGGIIRDHRGNWILGFAGTVLSKEANVTEILALLQGLRCAVQHNLTPLNVEIDAKEVIRLLTNNNILHANLLSDCRHLLKQLHDPTVSHAYREQNRLADKLA
ncbi:putative ribonuclease h protein, partial [Nicotiana attenuata]